MGKGADPNTCAAAAAMPDPDGPAPGSPADRAEIIARLRAARDAERADTGIAYPDPRDGAPMIGTGHCHHTCMEAENERLQMTGGWFQHPDGYHYEHSWLQDTITGEIVDPTADQWHLPDMPDVAFLTPGVDPHADRYLETRPVLDEDGCWPDCEYEHPDGIELRMPPSDPAQRGRGA